MHSLIINFLKRAVIIPVAVTGVFIAALAFAVPGMISWSQSKTDGAVDESLVSTYERADYEAFSRLEDNSYVGSISCSNISLKAAILFHSSKANCVSLSAASTEPWNNGSIVLIGSNVKTQFKSLHSAQIGDAFELELYGHEKYTYSLREVVHNKTEADIASYQKDGTLVMCLAYNDFSNLGNSYLYTIYVADAQ